MSRTFTNSADHLDSSAATVTDTPCTMGAWVNRAAAGSFGRIYACVGKSGADTDKFQIGEDIAGSSGKGAGYAYSGGVGNGALAGIAVGNSAWHFVCGVFSNHNARTATVDGANKGSSTNNVPAPSGINATVINGRIADHNFGIGGMLAHLFVVPRALSDIEVAYLGAGGNPNYVQHSNGSYWYIDQSSGTESDKWGANNLTVTGTSAGGSDPNLASYWTAAAFGNQSYTQGSAITSVNLTTKFDNVHSTFTSAIKQLGAATQLTTANGAGSSSTQLTLNSVTGFAAGDYASVNTGAPALILAISGNTLLLATAQTWANADNVYHYAVNASPFTGLTVSANSWSGTPGAGDVGTFNNCFFRATCSGNSALIADSPLFNVTVASSAAAPSFTGGPVNTSTNTDGWAAQATSNQTATWWRGVYLRGSSAPTATAIINGTGTGFVSHTSAALTATVQGTLTVTGLTLPIYDVYDVLTNGNGNSAVVASAALMKAPPAGKQYVTAAMVAISAATKANPCQITANGHGRSTGDWVEIFGVGGMTQLNGQFVQCTKVDANTLTLQGVDSTGYTTYTSGGTLTWGQSMANGASTTIATGDVWVPDTVTQPLGWSVSPRADGGFSIAAQAGVLTRENFTADCYSVSQGTLLGSSTIYVNNIPPSAPAKPISPIILPLNQLISPAINLASLATDQEGDTLTVTALTSLPTGLAVSSSTLTGTPTVQGITGVTFQWQDVAGESSTAVIPIVVGNVSLPQVANVGLDQARSLLALQAAYLSATYGTQDDNINATPAPAGTVIAQSYPAGTPLPPNTAVALTLSSGKAPPAVTPSAPAVSVVKSTQLLLQESQAPQPSTTFSELMGVCAAGAFDTIGTIYRFFQIPSSAIIVDVQMMNDANPIVSAYKCGVYNALGGGAIVPNSDTILSPNVSMDSARSLWTSVYAPAIAGNSSTVANVGKALWQLLGFTSDPSTGSSAVLYDLVLVAVHPGIAGGNMALRVRYALPSQGSVWATSIGNPIVPSAALTPSRRS